MKLSAAPLSFSYKLRLRKKLFFSSRFNYNNRVIKTFKPTIQHYRPRTIFSSQARNFYKNQQIVSRFLINKEGQELNNIGATRRKEV